jgi:predicted DNA-binding transcriptional regulator YafY
MMAASKILKEVPPMSEEALEKSARLMKISHLLYRNPHGLTALEMAGFCRVSPRTIQRDLKSLEDSGIPLWEDESSAHYGITKGYYLPPIHFDLNEATALYLAARLLARYSDEHNPLVVQALAKLAGAMPEAVARHVHHTIRSLAYKRGNPLFAGVFETVALGWATGRKVRIWHQAAGSENVHPYLLSPYFVEPSAVGYATHVIGYEESYFHQVQTFKLERVQAAQLTNEVFEVPADFDPTTLLDSAWGIMFGEELVEVRLRFSPQVARRVAESIWHPSQRLAQCDDGDCILMVQVAYPLEMKPWIRGWGPDCEVLAPPDLRAEVAAEMRQAAEVYSNQSIPN